VESFADPAIWFQIRQRQGRDLSIDSIRMCSAAKNRAPDKRKAETFSNIQASLGINLTICKRKRANARRRHPLTLRMGRADAQAFGRAPKEGGAMRQVPRGKMVELDGKRRGTSATR